MTLRNKLSRRTFLGGSTAALMLPILEANGATALAGSSSSGIPKRLVFLPMGYGVDTDDWLPDVKQIGANYKLPGLLEPFAHLKSDFSILQNLTNVYNGNPHAGTTNFLTSVDPRSNPAIPFANSVSCDQVAAEVIGRDTRHSSMAIGSSSRVDGHGGRFGYASWGRNGAPVGLYRDLNQLYAALFGTKGSHAEKVHAQLARKQSSLDALTDHARRLNFKISKSDRARVDEYFTTLRSIEKRLSKAQEWANTPYPQPPFPQPRASGGTEEIRLTLDLMHLALQSDSTRVMTYMLPTNPILKEIGTRLNPHKMSHFGPGKGAYEVQRQRDLILSELVADFLTKLKATKERDGSSLLDNTLVVYGSCLRRGHNIKNGPLMLAGHGGGGLKQGQNLVFKQNSTPLSNLWVSLLRHVGVEQDKFADSDRVLHEVGFS